MEKKKIVKKLSAVGVFGNIILSLFKLIAGIIGNSSAMVSDAIHSFSDVLATAVAYVGSVLSEKESDEGHPYGHERFECVAAIILSIILLVTGGIIGYNGIKTIISGDYSNIVVPSVLPLIAAIVSIVVKEAMYRYTMHYAIKMNSTVFKADAWHHRSDAFSSIGSLIGIVGARLGFPVMDSIAAVVISVFILKAAFDILKDAFSKMMDTSCDKDLESRMRETVISVNGVERIDLFHTRMFGSKVYVDVEIAVNRDSSLITAHDISEKVHDELESTYPDIKHVMVHVNPT